MTRRAFGRLVSRRCARCGGRFRLVAHVHGGGRIYCSAQCSQNQRQEWFQIRFVEAHGMSYRAWRLLHGFTVLRGRRLVTVRSMLGQKIRRRRSWTA